VCGNGFCGVYLNQGYGMCILVFCVLCSVSGCVVCGCVVRVCFVQLCVEVTVDRAAGTDFPQKESTIVFLTGSLLRDFLICSKCPFNTSFFDTSDLYFYLMRGAMPGEDQCDGSQE
jgi:hypothetical protein